MFVLQGELQKEVELKNSMQVAMIYEFSEVVILVWLQIFMSSCFFQVPPGTENNGYSHSGDSAPSMSDASIVFC